MVIGFDAKRAFTNNTGLGQYSRILISSLAQNFANNSYYLFTPKTTRLFEVAEYENIHIVEPSYFPATLFQSLWRSSWVSKEIEQLNINIYHGLSHEIPHNINTQKTKLVVTMHDLIFERYPQQYNPIDVRTYRYKFKHACKHADKVIAISEQTKRDLVQFYKVPPSKIEVCYQSCNPAFSVKVSAAHKEKVKERYGLPGKYFLYVGSIIERKNLLTVCKAYNELQGRLSIPLVVIGNGKKYKQEVKEYIATNGLQEKIIFLSDMSHVQAIESFKNGRDFPAIYQLAMGMIYPSIFEGFGIPVLEALCSGLPVITSNLSCLPETGGNAACYVDPFSVHEMAKAMMTIANDEEVREKMISLGYQHCQLFSPQRCTEKVYSVYENL